ncbi:hypothetical protein D3C76_1820690 [compost metagenome]
MYPAISRARNWSSASAMIGAKPQLPNTALKKPVKYCTMEATSTSTTAMYMNWPSLRNRYTISVGK